MPLAFTQEDFLVITFHQSCKFLVHLSFTDVLVLCIWSLQYWGKNYFFVELIGHNCCRNYCRKGRLLWEKQSKHSESLRLLWTAQFLGRIQPSSKLLIPSRLCDLIALIVLLLSAYKGAITSERKRKRRRLEYIATGLCCLFTLERILSESESDVASLPSCIGLQPIFGAIRSVLYRV